MMSPAIPSIVQQICALAASAETRRRASYEASQRTVKPEDRARRAELDRMALAAIARRRGLTAAHLVAMDTSRTGKAWTSRLLSMRRDGWIDVLPELNPRRTGVQPHRYAITDAGLAMLATLSAPAANPQGE